MAKLDVNNGCLRKAQTEGAAGKFFLFLILVLWGESSGRFSAYDNERAGPGATGKLQLQKASVRAENNRKQAEHSIVQKQ